LSERLCRDVAFHVAAVDFVENFSSPSEFPVAASPLEKLFGRAKNSAVRLLSGYSEEKSKAITQ
jgi:hypothetical protein